MTTPKGLEPRYIRSGEAQRFLGLFWRKSRGEFIPLTRREVDDAHKRLGRQFDKALWHNLIDAGCIVCKPIYGGRKELIETIVQTTPAGQEVYRMPSANGTMRKLTTRKSGSMKYITAPWLNPHARRAPVREVGK